MAKDLTNAQADIRELAEHELTRLSKARWLDWNCSSTVEPGSGCPLPSRIFRKPTRTQREETSATATCFLLVSKFR